MSHLSPNEAEISAWYAVLDAAQDPSLHALVERCTKHECLFSGDLDPALHEPGLRWGAAKAHVVLARRRAEGRR